MPPGVPHRILAVDDMPTNLLLLQACLPRDEFSFRGCGNAEELFLLLKGEPCDLLLLDVLLPGLDGYEIARTLKADPSWASIPIIFLTSLNQEDEVVKGFEAGGVDYVSKPFHKTELLLRLRTHLALKDKNEALWAANQARDRFFSILAHDLKNPLAGYQSLIHEVIQTFDRIERQDLLEVLQTIGQSAQNVYRLLETLLDWGRAQTGALVLEPQTLFLRFLVEESLESLEDGFRRKGIDLDVDLGLDRVWADRDTVIAIVRNLLSNALKFTRPGGRVTLRSRSVDDRVELTVADTGVGIPPARIGMLFRMENKVSTPGTNREPGTGLGLILCAEFAEKNHGSIQVRSLPGEGTTFILALPASTEVPG